MPNQCCYNPAFNDRVIIQADGSTDDNPAQEFGNSAASIPCTIVTVSGDETYRGRQLEAHLTHVVEMRFRTGIIPEMRLVVAGGIYSGDTLNIVSARPVRRSNVPYLELYCRELASQG